VRYELGSYIPEDEILHSHRREYLKPYIALTGWTLYWKRNMPPVRYEMGSYIPQDEILHSHRREYLTSFICEIIASRKFGKKTIKREREGAPSTASTEIWGKNEERQKYTKYCQIMSF
jgi:hypothetical protein